MYQFCLELKKNTCKGQLHKWGGGGKLIKRGGEASAKKKLLFNLERGIWNTTSCFSGLFGATEFALDPFCVYSTLQELTQVCMKLRTPLLGGVRIISISFGNLLEKR